MHSLGDSIVRLETFLHSPGRNYVTLKISTEDGLIGLGDATLNGREQAVFSYLQDHLAPTLIGRDPQRIEDIWQYMYLGGYWRTGGVGMAAIAAVDMALWDIKAKRAGMPLYQLLGGASRVGLLSYCHAFGSDTSELINSVSRAIDLGFKAVRVQTGIPGLTDVYGVTKSNEYEPARRTARPVEESWDTPSYLRHLPGTLESVRQAFGDELHLIHDVHHRLNPTEAAQLAKELERYHLFWLEDALPSTQVEGLRFVRQHSTTPLALGELFTEHADAHTVMVERLIDYLRVSVTHGGGITPVKRMLDFAGAFSIKSACHGPSDISPIGFSAALHLGLSIPNFGIQEFMGFDKATLEVFQTSFSYSDGLLHPGEEIGLGVGYDEVAGKGFPYQPAYLPVNRLQDGTMHHW